MHFTVITDHYIFLETLEQALADNRIKSRIEENILEHFCSLPEPSTVLAAEVLTVKKYC